jgi:hypothetical protein
MGSDIIAPGVLAVDCQVEILGKDPNSGATGAVLARDADLGVGVRTESAWHTRVVRLSSVT